MSIVIPVYNIEKYLQECLLSVQAQSLKDIEIICVNDGSTDNSLQILTEYADKDERIKIISQDNQGVSVARNSGLAIAQGKYIYFLDGDDFLAEKNTLEFLCETSEKTKLDILYFDIKPITDIELTPYEQFLYNRAKEYPCVADGQDLFCQMMQYNDFRYMPCGQFIKRGFLEKCSLKFYPGIYHESPLFSLQCILQAQKVAHIKKKLIAHRLHREGSIMSTFLHDGRHLYGYLVCIREILDFLQKQQFEQNILAGVNNLLEEYRQNVRIIYKALSPGEKQKIKTFPQTEQLMLDTIIFPLMVSIIIPIHNDQGYLQQCLDSVLTQSLKNIEIICIDDGSTDNSLFILKEYVQKDQRIRIITQKNTGSGVARNQGLSLAQGEYIVFIDADDYLLDTTTLNEMVSVAVKNNAEMVSANFKELCEGMLIESRCVRTYTVTEETLPPQEYGIPWFFYRNIYKKSFLSEHKIQFPNYLRGQDAVFLAEILSKVKKIYIYPKDFYVYRVPCDVWQKINNKQKQIDYIKHFMAVFQHLNNPRFYKAISHYESWICTFFIQKIPREDWYNYVTEACNQDVRWIKYFEHLLTAKTTKTVLEEQRNLIALYRANK